MGEHHQGRGHHARLTMRCPMTTGGMTAVTREDFSRAATNESAYRRVTVPVLRIDAGPGPAVALMAGVHGDEWEGQAAILELWHQLRDPEPRHGLLPAVNAEASLAGRRLSPNDGGNLNRAFLGPRALHGKRGGRAGSEAAAARTGVVDVRSGGASLRYLPSSVITLWPGRARSAPAGAGAPSACLLTAARKPAPCRPPPAVTAC